MPVNVERGDYLAALRDRGTELYLLGERIEEPADHPIIKTSINSLRMTYDLAISEPEVATVHSPLIDAVINRFLNVVEGPHDLMSKHAMQRRMGQPTRTCLPRCTGPPAISVLPSLTYPAHQVH